MAFDYGKNESAFRYRLRTKTLPVLVLLFAVNSLLAQTIHPTQTLNCNSIGQKQGLLQLNVKGMAIDNLTYLWVGTEDGLHRFNGYEFIPYLNNPLDSTSIKDDHIRSLLITNDTLWIATNTSGIQGFILSEGRFFDPIQVHDNSDLQTSYKVFKHNKNHVLFAVKNNLLLFNRHTKTSRIVPLPKSTKENYVTDVLQITNEKCWLATTSSGILELSNKTFKIDKITNTNNYDVRCFFKYGNSIFTGTKEGLFVYNLLTNNFTKTNFTHFVKCFYKLDETKFYIGTENGLFLYDIIKTDFTPIKLKNSENIVFEKVDINQIIGDTKGNLWIGTEGEGLLHYNTFQEKFKTVKLKLKAYPQTANISTFQFLKGEDSTLWIGSKYGIVKYFQESGVFKLYESKERYLIYTIAKDKNSTIWAGGFTSGLLKYDAQSDRFLKIKSSGNNLPDNDVIEIIPIDKNTLWVCTWAGGIHKFNINTEQFKELLIDGKRVNRIRTSLIDSKGNIWLGTDEGAYKISNSGVTEKYCAKDSSEHKLSGARIFAIQEDYLGNIWLGTNVGLTKLNVVTNKTTHFYKQKGLPNDFIYSILITKNNEIWMSTNFGISVLDTKRNTFKNYTKSDGLQNNEFNGKAGYKDRFGNFYFGGISGINIFKPSEIIESPYSAKIHIESVELFNMPIQKNELYKDTLQFKSNENVLTFNFSALNYLNPEECVYSYKMEGFDETWSPTTKSRSTTYTNLDPGNYTFKIRASNGLELWNVNSDEMTIIVVPLWYQSNAFKTIFIIVFLLSGILFYLYKTMMLKKDKYKLERIVTQRTEEVSDKNRELEQAFNEVENQRDNIQFLMHELKHRVKNNLQIISSLLNIQANSLESSSAIGALKMAKNRILAISNIENKIAVKSETVAIGQFIKELSDSIIKALADDENIKFSTVYNLHDIEIKKTDTTLIGLILNELITNTVKYAFDNFDVGNRLFITCKVEAGFMKLVIKDNGKGYSPNENIQTKSLGIELVGEMVKQLNGTLETNSINGTENIINVPVM